MIDMQITKICTECGDEFECGEEFAYGINECMKCVIKGYNKIDRLIEEKLTRKGD